ncbi:MFS transporter [Cryomyces antarcticus]|uniref:Major facilitator superfamily (MFS) profile domain-containing protein n=1 Tax=Cryomyces antarcticus TaxID=329879 RepID=A0ABR0LQW8_9PEZI|nr:hypothetical protein LTR39_000346 [Cryomyces antarcticus]KAK5020915.1 hypothetical protein LTR60_000190 [Cryomyces antarcticus]KAK5202060.1 hypothetical protein LTR16_000514 [Cryomyces antarcticus]
MGFFSNEKAEVGVRKQKINAYNILILFLLAPGSITYGYSAAIIATTLGQPSFSEYFGLATRSDANSIIGATGGLFFVGGVIGPLFLPWITDRFGRKWGVAIVGHINASNFIRLTCLQPLTLNAISAAFMAGSTNIGEFIFFRFVAGASSFMLLGAIPLLMNEVVPSSMRGGLVELHAVFFILGFAIASWVGFGFSFWTSGGLNAWRPPLAIQAGWALLGLPALYWIPESPRFLCMKDREEEAQAVLHRLHSDSADPEHEFAKAEFYQIQKQLHIDRTLGNSWGHLFRKPSYRKRVFLACGLTGLIQSSGDLVINNYGPTLYKYLGYGLVKQLLYPSAWLTFTLGMSVLCMPLIDRVPRNKMVAIGLWGCMSTLIVEAALVANFVPSDNENALRAAVAMLFVFQVFDTAFLNGPEWAYLGEMFPTHIRAKGYCLAMSMLALVNIVYTQAAPVAFANAGWKYYLLFILLPFFGGIIVWVWYPNTRGLPLEEIAAMFGDQGEVAIYQAEIELDRTTHTIVEDRHGKGVTTFVENRQSSV